MKRKRETKEVVVNNVVVSPEITKAVLPEISDELLVEILVKLPVKFLMRVKCISKLWFSLITSRYLSNHFLQTSPRSRFTVYLVNQHKPGENLLLTSSNHDYSNISLSVRLDQDLSMPVEGGYFVSSVRGLVCFRNVGRVQVCNFTTRQVVELPTIKGHYRENNVWCCFGYDPVTDEYKVLSTVWEVSRNRNEVTSEHHVLTLGAGASWRKTRNHIPHHPFSHYYKGLIINGVLYYGGWTDKAKCVVMSFDFSSEEFKMFEMPTTVNMSPNFSCVDLMIYKGKVAVFECFTFLINDKVNVWVLEEEDKKKKSQQWSEKMTFVLPFSQMNLKPGDVLKMGSTGRSGHLWFTKAFLSGPQSSFFFIYDLERNEITRTIETRPLRNKFTLTSRVIATLWDNVESVMYLET